jgi:hypothetical protein
VDGEAARRPGLFVIRAQPVGNPAFIAEAADVLDPARWQSILRTHPDVSLTTEAEATKTYPAPLYGWRIRYPQVSDERWARAKEVSLGRAR